ncbi:hypothetical protein J2W34_005316 [Variovorax boronicumulans]|uniref:hypothetical protein n=1 Tax=Variovorax boronicumulans TaxID=436515 RepID=UPI0027830E0E|nr:hypothetical protein [Variovorax boronicumulans]MDQ0073508.1 hypothetical protein [Variovorax boronicumulans]
MTSRITFIAAACLLAGGVAFAQMPPPSPGGPVPPAPIAATPEAGIATVSGRAQQWLINPNGEADGLLLSDGTQVAFPPHLSAAVMQMLKPGETVQVSGWRAPNVPVVRAQTLVANGRSVTDQPPTPGMAPPPPRESGALSAMTAGGRIARLLYTDRGDVHGVMLEDKTIVRFPPHIGAAYGAQLQPGAPLHARGWGTRGAQGAALEATSLGQSADTVREVFSGPGLEPAPPVGGPRGPRGRGPVPPAPVMPLSAPNPAS